VYSLGINRIKTRARHWKGQKTGLSSEIKSPLRKTTRARTRYRIGGGRGNRKNASAFQKGRTANKNVETEKSARGKIGPGGTIRTAKTQHFASAASSPAQRNAPYHQHEALLICVNSENARRPSAGKELSRRSSLPRTGRATQ